MRTPSRAHGLFWFSIIAVTPGLALGATLQVGPGKTYDKPCAAIAAASDGDTIEIDAAGNYDGDVCGWTKNALTLKGVNGRAKIDAAGQNSRRQGHLGHRRQRHDRREHRALRLHGAGRERRGHPAGGHEPHGSRLLLPRQRGRHPRGRQGGQRRSSSSTREFNHNGAGDGYSHNLYINHVAKLDVPIQLDPPREDRAPLEVARRRDLRALQPDHRRERRNRELRDRHPQRRQSLRHRQPDRARAEHRQLVDLGFPARKARTR